jgi:replicative DNA helicase
VSEPVANLDAERSVLGAMLVSNALISPVIAQCGLRAEHFYLERHAEVFRAICGLHDRGEALDIVAAHAELERRGTLGEVGGKDAVAALAATVPAAGNATGYAKLVIEAAQWRHYDACAKRLAEAVGERDEGKVGDEIGALGRSVAANGSDLPPDALADLAYEVADQGGKEAFPWPFGRLNALTAGGIRRGQYICLSGHTSMGKSFLCDQILDAAAKAGARSWLYMNEMDPEERVGRLLQRHGGVPYDDFIRGKLGADDRQRMVGALNRGLRFGITPVAGWTPREVANHIRLHRWDVCAIDILHRFPGLGEEREVSEAVKAFAETAKLAECAVILVCHVNRNRIQAGVRPRPTRGDLRGSGAIENDADIVCFVHRDQDPETYEPLPEAQVYLDKARGFRVGGLEARFDARRLEFLPIEEIPARFTREAA